MPSRLPLKIALSLLAAAAAVPSASGQAVSQGPIINPANGNAYYLLTSSNWTDARAFAVSQLGGDLVTINDAAENDFVRNTFANPAGRVWIGYNDISVEGTFVWSSGQTPAFTNWEPGEPNNSSNEDYVLMYGGGGRWNDAQNVANPPAIGPVSGVVEVQSPGNNVCANAISVSAGGTFNGTLVNATFSPEDGGATCGDAGGNVDVWYVFTAPCSGRMTATTCGTHDTGGVDAGLDTVLSLRSTCGGAEIACNDDAAGDPCGNADNGNIRDSFVTRDLAPGEVVYIRVSPFSTAIPRPFILNISFTVPNDECATPSPIGVGSTTICNTNATTSAPTQESGCAGVNRTMNRDLWFRHVPSTNGVFTVQTCSAGTNNDTILAAYSACPAAIGQAITCNDDTTGCGATSLSSRIRINGTAGTPVLLRLASFNAPGGTAVVDIFCAADYNLSGTVSVQDIFDFLAGYFANNPAADFNGSGGISVQDIFDFLAAYFAGCM